MDSVHTVLVEEDTTFSFIEKISPCATLFDGHLRVFSWDPENPTCVIREPSKGLNEYFPLFAVDGMLVTALNHYDRLPICLLFTSAEPQLKLSATLCTLALLSYCQTKKCPSTVVVDICRSKRAQQQKPSLSFLREIVRVSGAAVHFNPIFAGSGAHARNIARVIGSLMTGITPLKFIPFSSESELQEWLKNHIDELATARLDLYSSRRMTYLVESFKSLAATWPDDMKRLSPNMFHFRDADEENCNSEEQSIAPDSDRETGNRNRDSMTAERGESHFSTLGGSESVTATKKYRAVLLDTIPEEQ